MKRKIRVFIADDHALMRVGLRSMLDLEPDIEIVGEATNGEDAVRSVLAIKPDVVIMDLMMPRLNGAEATRRILQSAPQTKIIILTSFGSSEELQQAVSNGAIGLQPKEDPTENLINAIHAVVDGRTAFPPGFTRTPAPDQPIGPLTDRQSKILKLISDGLSGKQIADALDISEAGVKKHVSLICSKLGAANRSEAVAIGLKKHLLKI